jgi:hypothetical protein
MSLVVSPVFGLLMPNRATANIGMCTHATRQSVYQLERGNGASMAASWTSVRLSWVRNQAVKLRGSRPESNKLDSLSDNREGRGRESAHSY